MKLPIQSANIMRNASAQPMVEQAIYPAQFAQFRLPIRDLHFCWGWDEDSYTCRLYLGTKQMCQSLTPCWGWGTHF